MLRWVPMPSRSSRRSRLKVNDKKAEVGDLVLCTYRRMRHFDEFGFIYEIDLTSKYPYRVFLFKEQKVVLFMSVELQIVNA
jgi:hypothetical protein